MTAQRIADYIPPPVVQLPVPIGPDPFRPPQEALRNDQGQYVITHPTDYVVLPDGTRVHGYDLIPTEAGSFYRSLWGGLPGYSFTEAASMLQRNGVRA